MTRERWIVTGLVAALLLSIVPLVAAMNLGETVAAGTIQNVGHIPMFAWLTTLMWLLAARWLGARVWVAGQYIAVVGISIALGLLTELVQMLGPRDGDLGDLLANTLGAVCAIAWLATCDRRLDGRRVRERRWRLALRSMVAVAVIAASIPLIETLQVYRDRTRRLPTLYDYTTQSQEQFVRIKRLAFEFVDPPDTWSVDPPAKVMSIRFSERLGASMILLEPYPDWSGYETLAFEILHPGHGPIELGLRIDDQHRHRDWKDRFNDRLHLVPGINRIAVPIEEIERGPAERDLQLERIARILLYPVEPTGDYHIYLGPIRLEGERTPEVTPSEQ